MFFGVGGVVGQSYPEIFVENSLDFQGYVGNRAFNDCGVGIEAVFPFQFVVRACPFRLENFQSFGFQRVLKFHIRFDVKRFFRRDGKHVLDLVLAFFVLFDFRRKSLIFIFQPVNERDLRFQHLDAPCVFLKSFVDLAFFVTVKFRFER